MLKCRKCGQSDFGVIARQIISAPFRITNGEQTPLDNSETKQELEYNFCFGCNAPITNEDLYEKEKCNTCGEEVEELINGNCESCNAKLLKAKELEEKKKALNKLTKAELIEMLLSGEINQEELAGAMAEPTESKVENSVEETKEETKQEVNSESVEQNSALNETMPNLEPNVDANLSIVGDEDLMDLGAPDVNETVMIENFDDEIDILAQIDNAVDLSSLNIHDEDINQQL